MTTLDSGEMLGRAEAVANDDEVAYAKFESLQAKVSDLNDSNHKLRVENLRLRSRIEYHKSCRSFENKLLLLLWITIGLCFLYAVISKFILMMYQ